MSTVRSIAAKSRNCSHNSSEDDLTTNHQGRSDMDVQQAEKTTEQMKQLIAYIVGKVIKRKAVEINEDTPLISSGLVDSFALVEIFVELQSISRRKIPASKVQTKDMDTVRMMLATAERFGKPVP